jgi:hypothetical protein
MIKYVELYLITNLKNKIKINKFYYYKKFKILINIINLCKRLKNKKKINKNLLNQSVEINLLN